MTEPTQEETVFIRCVTSPRIYCFHSLCFDFIQCTVLTQLLYDMTHKTGSVTLITWENGRGSFLMQHPIWCEFGLIFTVCCHRYCLYILTHENVCFQTGSYMLGLLNKHGIVSQHSCTADISESWWSCLAILLGCSRGKQFTSSATGFPALQQTMLLLKLCTCLKQQQRQLFIHVRNHNTVSHRSNLTRLKGFPCSIPVLHQITFKLYICETFLLIQPLTPHKERD